MLPVAEVGGVSQPRPGMPGPLPPTPISYPPMQHLCPCPLAHEPGRQAQQCPPWPCAPAPGSTTSTGTPVSGTLPQLTHHYGQSMPFLHVASTQAAQSTYHPSSRQAPPNTAVLQPVSAYLTPKGFQPTVDYVSPVSTSFRVPRLSQLQSTSDRLPITQATFSHQDAFLPVSQ